MNYDKSSNDEMFIITARSQYVVKGFESRGYRVYRPYKDERLITRIAREVWFRIGLPESIWYSKKYLKKELQAKEIRVHDPLITADYLKWLQSRFSSAKIEYQYQNLIGHAKHLRPEQVPSTIALSTYDEKDSKQYNIQLRQGGEFPRCYIGKKQEAKYDVFFAGADKGRGEYLLEL